MHITRPTNSTGLRLLISISLSTFLSSCPPSMDNERSDDESDQTSSFLQALNTVLKELQSKPLYYLRVDINSPSIKFLIELENRAHTICSTHNSILSNLTHLKNLINNLRLYQYYTPRSFIQCGIISYQISCVSLLVQKEIQLCFDKENIVILIKVLQESSDEEKLRVLDQFERRLSSEFDLELQGLILRARLFPFLESVLCDDSCTLTVREKVGAVIAALAHFNRNVFVGLMLMGYTIQTLVSMGSSKSLEILTSLVKLIRGHLVDEMELNGEIPNILGLLSSEDMQVRIMAIDCILEMAYYGRKEVIEVMIEYGLVEKLVFLQRSELESDLGSNIGQVQIIEDDKKGETLVNHPIYCCIARFAVQVEVGEGMKKKEKKEIKMEILRRARDASVSEAEAATVVAEVLWGSYP